MAKTIEFVNVVAEGDTIKYKLRDNTGLHLLKEEEVDAWVKYCHTENFGLSLESLPESVLLIPAMLYLMPVTYFYGVDLVVPSMDKTLYEDMPTIYAAYSKIYGPFKEEWRGKVIANAIVENPMPESRFDRIVFFSGGVDSVHAGINNPGRRNVLVTVPSIEYVKKYSRANTGEDFLFVKSRLIREFSEVTESDWIMITNNFMEDVFDDKKIQYELQNFFKLDSEAFQFDGWFGLKYIGNLLSSAPFAYAMGIGYLVFGSAFEQLEETCASNMSGANPDLSDSFKFAGVSFTEQDGLLVRRSQKVKRIVDWCLAHGKRTQLWVCFDDSREQCGVCTKCVRTQLNLLVAGQNPADWGFKDFNERQFSRLVRGYGYQERKMCWLWDNQSAIDDNRVYPYCDDLLHWFKEVGYKKYSKRNHVIAKYGRIFRLYRYPHYMKVLVKRAMGKVR